MGAGGFFFFWTFFSRLSPSLWEMARYKLKYCLKGPLSSKQPTNKSPLRIGEVTDRQTRCQECATTDWGIPLQWLYNLIPTNQFRSSFTVNLHIIFLNSLMGFKVICQLEKEPLKGLANVQEIFSKTISLVIYL